MINIRRINCPPSLAQPISQLRLQVVIPKSYCFSKDRLGDSYHCRRITAQDGLFAPSGGDGANPLQLRHLIGQSLCLLEELGRPGLSTPDPH
jgi:hypothetical protein